MMNARMFGFGAFFLSSLLACNNGSQGDLAGDSDTSSAAGAGGDSATQSRLAEACALLDAKKIVGLEQELAVVCSGKSPSPLAKKLLEKAFNGKNDLALATKEVKLESRGDDTEILFAGAVHVPKSVEEIRGLTKSVLLMSMDDTKNGVSISGKILSGPTVKSGAECYVRKELVSTTVFGLKMDDDSITEACTAYVDKSKKILVNHESLVKGRSENGDNPAGNKLVIHLETDTNSTYILTVVRKILKNKGFSSIAEDKVRSQPKPLLAKFHGTLSARKPIQTISSDGPRFGDAADNDLIGNGEWAYGRTKLSCDSGDGVVGVNQEKVYGGATHKPAVLSLECREVSKPRSLRVQEPPQGIPMSYDITCQSDEYVAGVSYVRYNDKATLLADGTRSLLCAKREKNFGSCSWKERSCGANGVLRGLRVRREGGLICAGQNSADAGKGCYTVESVYCCE
jgi:hypothetical protein